MKLTEQERELLKRMGSKGGLKRWKGVSDEKKSEHGRNMRKARNDLSTAQRKTPLAKN